MSTKYTGDIDEIRILVDTIEELRLLDPDHELLTLTEISEKGVITIPEKQKEFSERFDQGEWFVGLIWENYRNALKEAIREIEKQKAS
jgi:hypothetical protein